ncbi:hypothetical protein SAMN02927895_00815 [Belnapia rosea]|nr:hypothetical protein SAMN02927895_00815 [Belnapia rosea]
MSNGDDPTGATFTPFVDEAASTCIGSLTVENRTDRISLYGSLDLMRDRTGLADARRLQKLLEAVIETLQSEGDHLPSSNVGNASTETVRNPFR